MPVLPLTNIRDTTLWKRLEAGFAGADGDTAKRIARDLEYSCQQAYDRMRGFPSLHPEYTLHDEVHLLRVTELMSRVMPATVADQLNPVEIMLLILAAHFHDQGMVMERSEVTALSGNPQFTIFRDNWNLQHPNLRDVTLRLRDRTLSDEEASQCRSTEQELYAALLTDYVRTTHGDRSAEFVRTTHSTDSRWTVANTNVADLVARLCQSHVRPASDLTPANGFRHDEAVGPYRVNLAYLGLVLRLADILDFDRDRTPDALYRTIDFRSNVSLQEWGKHRSVEGWVIEPGLVQFTMRCERPEYQRAAYQFMDWIDKELGDAQAVCHDFPASASRYTIDLPISVDRSRIEPKDNAYIYYDMEFSLSRDEVVKLLMTEELYGSSSLCVRELLQNGLDALRHRKALIRRDNGTDWPHGEVSMYHEIDSAGHEVVRCVDNGVGMDRLIIERFLTNVGRSYYRSPEFEQERASFRGAGVDFDPCAKFGIGFMSCFMLGDRIIIRTRRDKGPARGMGEPLVVEINGLGGIVVVRPGSENQPVGTTVEVTGRKKPGLLDRYSDRVKLIAVLDGYALACEFPIKGQCSIPEIADAINIPPTVAVPKLRMEGVELSQAVTLEQVFSEIDPRLGGALRAIFLIDDSGHIALQTSKAEWRLADHSDKGGDRFPHLYCEGRKVEYLREHGEDHLCLDGILVAGEPGRDEERDASSHLGFRGSPLWTSPYSVHLLDIRGAIKPPLTPARVPPERTGIFRRSPSWDRIQVLVSKAEGKLWAQVVRHMGNFPDPEVFWGTAGIYSEHGLIVPWIPYDTLWSKISIPIAHKDGASEWLPMSHLPLLEAVVIPAVGGMFKDSFFLQTSDGARVAFPPEVERWWYTGGVDDGGEVKEVVTSMTTVTMTNVGPRLEVRHPEQPDASPWEYTISAEIGPPLFTLPYSGEVQKFLSVHMAAQNVNRKHPLVAIALEKRYLEVPTALQEFASSAVWCFSDPKTADRVRNSTETIGRRWKLIGSLYKDVDWQNVADDVRPPYEIYSTDGSVLQITNGVLERWANALLDEKG